MKIHFTHKLLRITFIIFLALVCGGQVYQSVHLHHFHTSDSVAFEINSHPLAIDHPPVHQHHEDNSSHEEDSEHKHKKTAWRNAPCSKSFINAAFDSIGQPVYANDLPGIGLEKTRPFPPTSHHPRECYIKFGVIRGPPLFA